MTVSYEFRHIQQMQFDLFKSQDPQIGYFDIIFEVEGKKIYGYKSLLHAISSTLNSMLSDRWNKNKDEPIPITDYNFDDFYQFLTFIYSAQCKLTEENIVTMIDMAEFYQVPLFKSYCDEYLSKKLNIDNVFRFLDLGKKYSLIKLQNSIKPFFIKSFFNLGNSDDFSSLKSSFLSPSNPVCISPRKSMGRNSKVLLNASKEIFTEVIISVKDKVNPEYLFLMIFKWVEKQALDKQAIDSNYDRHDLIKKEFSDFLPYIAFDKMELEFLADVVAPCSFIFSYDEMNKILKHSFPEPKCKVTVTNNLRQKLRGTLIPDDNVIQNIKSAKSYQSHIPRVRRVCWKTKCKIPSSLSPLQKRNGIEWYLAYFGDGDIGVAHAHHIQIDEKCYLLAEMIEDKSGFSVTDSCKIEIKFE